MSIFKSKYFWLTLGFVLLVAAILVLGAWLEVSLVVRFAAVMAVMMVGMILLMIGFIRASRSASQIEQSLRVQAKQQLVNTRPDKRAEIEELQKQLEVAIERLKRSKLGRGKGGRAALYAMPWYLFIGPPAAGKTTAILNSGLNFPLGTDRIRGVGGTRNCDWFFTDQAILLDTAGRYVTEHEDEEEWYAFLDTLKKHRKDRPINGAIVGISLDELAQATPDEIEWHASTIRERVDELVARLGVRFPVFLVFTKCDLMQGFVEFFGDLSRKEREQIWGSTFVREEIEKKEAGALFEEEFHKLYKSLLALRSARLNRSMKREDRRKVYVFPLEFAAMKENLSLFVSRLFQPNPYQESPVFRGFYFSSGTQEGAPIDRVIQSIARQFDLPPDSTDNGSGPQVVKSYFIKELFTDVIVPDQYMVRQTSRQAVRGRLAKAGMGVAGIFLLALWLLGLSQALLRSQHSLGEVEQAAMAAAGVNWLDPQRHESELANMDALRERLERLDRDARRFRPLRLGLDRSGTVLPATRRLYLERVHAYAATNLFGDMQDHLRNAVRIRDLDAARRDSVRDGLRAYLLMTTETGRLEEEANAVFLRRYLTERSMAGQREVAFSEMDARREALDRQFGVYATALARGDISSFGGDVSLVSRARSLIYEPPSVDRLYRRIKEDGEVEFEPLTLADILRGRYLDMFAGQPQVPGIFTKRGWATYVEPAIAGMAEGGGRPDWIMGHSEDEEPAELADRDQLTSQLEQLYFSEYAMAWERFLRDVRLARFGDLRSAVQFLTELSSPYESPILYILAQAT
ncbi:MAG: type VI secretion system membrane subunit TssM, partial [Rhodothermales bacterium]